MSTSPNPFDQFDSSPRGSYSQATGTTPDASTGNPFDQFDRKKTPLQMAQEQPQTPVQHALEAANAPYKAAASAASGIGASIAGGLSGLAQGAKNLFSPGMPAGDRVRQIEDALTYQPNSVPANNILKVVSAIPNAIASGADKAGGAVTDVTGIPALGAATNTTLQAIPQLLARGLRAPVKNMLAKATDDAAATASRNSLRDTTLKEARDAGYVVPPSHTGGGFIAKRLESIGGKAATDQEAALRNQEVTNKLVRQEAGLDPDKPISVESLEKRREQLAEPYRQIAALDQNKQRYSPYSSKPNASAKALADLKDARFNANAYFKHFDIAGDPESLKKARAADLEADQIEKYLETRAQAANRPELVDQLREARKQIAKTFDIERALNVADGNVDAKILGRALDRGRPLTGNLKTIAKFAEAFPKYARVGTNVPTPGVSKLEPVASAAAGMAGAATLGPAGAAAAALPLLSGPARTIALSDIMNKGPQYGPSSGLSFADMATKNVNALSLIPGLTRRDQP